MGTATHHRMFSAYWMPRLYGADKRIWDRVRQAAGQQRSAMQTSSHAAAVFAKPSFARIGSSETRKIVASSGISIVCWCQHGTAMTSPGERLAENPPSTANRG